MSEKSKAVRIVRVSKPGARAYVGDVVRGSMRLATIEGVKGCYMVPINGVLVRERTLAQLKESILFHVRHADKHAGPLGW